MVNYNKFTPTTGATVIDESSTATTPDGIAALLAQVRSASVGLREKAARDLLAAVHGAIYPMCLKLLGNADEAYEAEAEAVARLLARTDDRDADAITNGTAYVRQIARNICHDLHRESRRRHDRSLDDLDEGQAPPVDDHASSMNTPVPAPTPLDHDLIATFGYTSKRALADLECLTRPELQAVILRQEGYSYSRIARLVGAGLTTGTAEKHGERGLHKLRGMVHVQVWRQEPPSAWTDPPCAVLSELQTLVKEQLADGKRITATLYLQIGRHLDPAPNRKPGDERVPLCSSCVAQRERSRRAYWWLLIMLMPFPAAPARPSLRPVSLNTTLRPVVGAAFAEPAALELEAGSPPAAGRPHRRRRVLVAAAIVALLLVGGGGAFALRFRAEHDAALPSDGASAAPGGPGGPAAAGGPLGQGGPGGAGGAVPSGDGGAGRTGLPPGGLDAGPSGGPAQGQQGASASKAPPGGQGPYTFADVVDWDGACPDVVASDSDGVLWLYPGSCAQGYSGHLPVRLSSGWEGLAFAGVADWDNDSYQDVLARDGDGTLWRYPGNGTGTDARVWLSNGWGGFTFAGVADWDDDSYQDVLARDGDGTLWLYPGNDDGTTDTRVQIGNGWGGFTFAGVADWDKDLDHDDNDDEDDSGGLDIVARDAGGLLWLYRGDSTRGYSHFDKVQIGNGWGGFTFAGVIDWDNDGNQDIVARDPTGLLWLYLGQSVAEYRGLARVQIGNGW